MCGVWGFTPNLTHRSAWMDWIIYIKKNPHTSIRLETDNGLLLGVNLIFIIMNNTAIALNKFLSTMVRQKYPQVSEVEVREREDDNFNVYLAVKFEDIYGSNVNLSFAQEIREYVRRMSKYILGDDDGEVEIITFYDPNHL